MRFIVLFVLMTSCAQQATTPLREDTIAHDAYVWRRVITDGVRSSMRDAPTTIERFKVLAREHEGDNRREVWVNWKATDFDDRSVALVWRIDGTAPLTGIDITSLVARAQVLVNAGVKLSGIEIDHDCPTRTLDDYARWLAQQRLLLPMRWSLTITALPTWADAPKALTHVANNVDGITLQVHAVAAPVLFAPMTAATDVRRFVDAIPSSAHGTLRVALPTYRVTLATGEGLSVAAADIDAFRVATAWPRTSWFRLGADDDKDAWGPTTIAAVIAGVAQRSKVNVHLAATDDSALSDVVLRNDGVSDADAPTTIMLLGASAADGSRGYALGTGMSLHHQAPPRMRAGEEMVIGWVRGQQVQTQVDGVR
jgi:Protein of unknown function (DUF3142)